MDNLTPLKAIKAKCLDCCCGYQNEVKKCPVADCPLYAYRFGKNSQKNRRELTLEEKDALRHRLEDARKKRTENM